MRYKIADSQADFFKIMRIRTDVFIIEQNVDVDIELDEYDYDAIQIIAYDNDTAVGCARVLFVNNEVSIGRIAVVKEYRKMHVGEGMMNFIFNLDELKDTKEIIIHAQCSAQGFYEKLGFVQTSDVYQEANIDHIMMVKTL